MKTRALAAVLLVAGVGCGESPHYLDIDSGVNADGAEDAASDASIDADVDAGIDAIPPDANPAACGLRIAFQQGAVGSREIWVADLDGSNAVNVSNSTADDINPTWSPDGGRLAFQSNRNGNWDIVVAAADGTGLVNVTMGVTEDDERPAWSPNGAKIAFVRGQMLHVMNPNGAGLFQVAALALTTTDVPVWSPDSSQLAFLHVVAGAPDLYVVAATMGATATNITNTTLPEGSKAWAPATQIAYQGYGTSGSDIFRIGGDGTGRFNLTDDSPSNYSPQWSPDGNVIVYTSNADGNREVWTVAATGGTGTRITDNNYTDSSSGDFPQAVSPDGEWVLFDRRASSGASEIGVVHFDGSGLDTFTVDGGANARGGRFSPCL